jgi:hypothetical protein
LAARSPDDGIHDRSANYALISLRIGAFELRDGLVVESSEYFGSPFPAEPERARFADQA